MTIDEMKIAVYNLSRKMADLENEKQDISKEINTLNLQIEAEKEKK